MMFVTCNEHAKRKCNILHNLVHLEKSFDQILRIMLSAHNNL